jgi:F0F1-type ATP synthase assembly protein I
MHAENKRDVTRQLNNSSGSFELVLVPVVLSLGGWWIDSHLGTAPWFAVVGAVLGLVGATYRLRLEYLAAMACHEADAPWVARDESTSTSSERAA